MCQRIYRLLQEQECAAKRHFSCLPPAYSQMLEGASSNTLHLYCQHHMPIPLNTPAPAVTPPKQPFPIIPGRQTWSGLVLLKIDSFHSDGEKTPHTRAPTRPILRPRSDCTVSKFCPSLYLQLSQKPIADI